MALSLERSYLGLKVDLIISDQRSNKGLFLSAEEVLDILEKFNYHMKKPSVNNSISFKLAFFNVPGTLKFERTRS